MPGSSFVKRPPGVITQAGPSRPGARTRASARLPSPLPWSEATDNDRACAPPPSVSSSTPRWRGIRRGSRWSTRTDASPTRTSMTRSARAACVLADLRVRRGTTVAASAANGIDLVVAFLATMRLGARWVGVDPRLPSGRPRLHAPPLRAPGCSSPTATTLSRSGVGRNRRRTRSRRTLAPRVARATALRAAPTILALDPLAPAAIAYTSGTTGHAEGRRAQPAQRDAPRPLLRLDARLRLHVGGRASRCRSRPST